MKLTCVRLGMLLLLCGSAMAADMNGTALPWPSLTAHGSHVVSVERLRHPAPAAAERELTLAHQALMNDDAAESIQHLELALRIYPQYAEAYSEMASARLRLGESGRALEALEKAVALTPKSMETRLNLALVQLQISQVEQAESTVRQAIALDPSAKKAHYLLAVILNQKGDLRAAGAELQTYLDLDGRTYRTAAQNWMSASKQNN